MFGAGWVGCAERAQKKAVDANRPPHGGRGKTEFYNPYSPQPPNLSGIKNDTREQGGAGCVLWWSQSRTRGQ